MDIRYLPGEYTAVTFLTTSVLSYVSESVSLFYAEGENRLNNLTATEQFIPHDDVPDLYFQIWNSGVFLLNWEGAESQ